MTVYDLIFLGGGFENDNHLANTFLDRADYISFNSDGMTTNLRTFNLDSVLNGNSFSRHKLKMGDKIVIYSKLDVLGVWPNGLVYLVL